jgi:hypothetical protein
MFIDYEEQLKLAGEEYDKHLKIEKQLKLAGEIYVDGEENLGTMMMAATSVSPEQHGDKKQPYCGVDPDNCLRFCNKLMQSITMDLSANNKLTRQLDPRLQYLGNTSANKLMAERSFLMNKVNSVQSQLESMRRDSRSVSGVNTCFYSGTHVYGTLPDLGTQLWGDRGPVYGDLYANKPVCIEQNVDILEFMMREHGPKGIPQDIQSISTMIEMALVVDSMQDLVEITVLNPSQPDATALKAGSYCKNDKVRIPCETAEDGQTLDPRICRLTSMEIHEMLGHMGGTLNPFDMCDQFRHYGHHVMETTPQYHKTKIGLVWCGTVIYFDVASLEGYSYAAVFKDMGSGQL